LDFNAFHYQSPLHEFKHVSDWNTAEIEKPWDVVLIDHSPGSRRIEEVKRLANYAKYIIIHDSNTEFESEYQYSQIYPLFKYKSIWTGDARHASILSNLVDLTDFWSR